jgi:polyisoprenoid-binding protein YceI
MNKVTSLAIASLFTLAFLAACQQQQVRQPTAAPPVPAVDTKGAARYDVDGTASTIHVLVYRAGAAARMGHNHVVSSKELRGTLYLQNELSRSRIELVLPVATFAVDEPQARAAEGQDFATEVPQDAREGTRRNLLRSEVLDAEHYPEIKLQSVTIAGTRAQPKLTMRITIKNASRDIPVGASVQESAGTIRVKGEFALKQTDFGITPFSVALGALQVQDELNIKFSILCRHQQ